MALDFRNEVAESGESPKETSLERPDDPDQDPRGYALWLLSQATRNMRQMNVKAANAYAAQAVNFIGQTFDCAGESTWEEHLRRHEAWYV